MKPTWEELAGQIYAEATREKICMPADLPSEPAALLQKLATHTSRVQDVCEHWALTGTWPLMLPVEWWLIQFRLWHGWRLALRLSRPDALRQTLPVPDPPIALRWLLVDSWLPGDLDRALAIAPDKSPPAGIAPSSPPDIRG